MCFFGRMQETHAPNWLPVLAAVVHPSSCRRDWHFINAYGEQSFVPSQFDRLNL